MSTTDGSTPGVQSHVPGEDDSDSSIGGTVPDGTALSHVDDDSLPAEDGLSSGGDTVADDADTTDDETATAQTDPDVAEDLDAADEADSPEHRSGTGDNAAEDLDGPGAADEGAAPSGSAAEQGDDAVRAAQASAFTHP